MLPEKLSADVCSLRENEDRLAISVMVVLNDEGEIKLADFGLGRKFIPDSYYTSKVVTLWYRAPELLLGLKQYNLKVDVWSIGCVIAEMFIHDILFRSTDWFNEEDN